MSYYFLIAAAICLAAAWYFRNIVEYYIHYGMFSPAAKVDFPVVGSPSDPDFVPALVEGCKKYPERPFIVPANPPVVILPFAWYLEFKNSGKGSLGADIYDRLLGPFTHLRTEQPPLVHAVRQELTRSISEILPIITDETHYAFREHLGAPADWTRISLYPVAVQTVALLSGRTFVGLPLSRDAEWLDAFTGYTVSLARIFYDQAAWHPLLKPLVARFLPAVRRVRGCHARAAKWLRPLVAEALAQDDGGDGGDAEKAAPARAGTRLTLLSWVLSHSPPADRNAEAMGAAQMSASFAAIHTTSTALTWALTDLAGRPEYIPEIRKEIEDVLAEDGFDMDENGQQFIGKATFGKMKKLDSFLKESQRFTSANSVLPTYKMTEDFTFKNGTKIPKGLRVTFPSYVHHRSSDNLALSEEYNAETGNPGPEVFDGFRWARMREIPGRENKHQVMTTSMDVMAFGHGPHACPGRFFAMYEVKLVLVELLRSYDIRLAGGVDMSIDPRTQSFATRRQLMTPMSDVKLDIRKRVA